MAFQLQQPPRTAESSNAARNMFLSVPPAASSLLMVVNETAKEMREGRRRTEFLLKGISISGKSPLGYVEQQIYLEAFFKKVNVAL